MAVVLLESGSQYSGKHAHRLRSPCSIAMPHRRKQRRAKGRCTERMKVEDIPHRSSCQCACPNPQPSQPQLEKQPHLQGHLMLSLHTRCSRPRPRSNCVCGQGQRPLGRCHYCHCCWCRLHQGWPRPRSSGKHTSCCHGCGHNCAL